MANPRSSILKRAYRFLARMGVSAVLVTILLVVAALGSCFPQLAPSVADDAGRLAQWEAGVRARYGALTDLLIAGGAFRCFHSPVFLTPLALLAVVTLVCTLNRWRAVWRRVFHRPVRCPETTFDTAPYTADVVIATTDMLPLARQSLERRGFCVRAEAAADATYLRGDRNRLAPLATLVTHLAALLLLLGVTLNGVCGWREEITVAPGELAEVGHGSGLALRNEGFTITRYPDGSAAGYEAAVAVVAGRQVTRGTVLVNQPLSYGPLELYLRGYGGQEGRYDVTLLIVRDPGYGLVVAAGLLLLLGLSASFNFPHCYVHARIEPEGVLRLAGRAERRAYGFEREFEMLAEELKRVSGANEARATGS